MRDPLPSDGGSSNAPQTDSAKIAAAVAKAAPQTGARPSGLSKPIKMIGASKPAAKDLEGSFDAGPDIMEPAKGTVSMMDSKTLTKIEPVNKEVAGVTDQGGLDNDGRSEGVNTNEEVEGKQQQQDNTVAAPKKATDLNVNINKNGDVNKRDYSGFTPDEAKHLKQMSNGAYEYFSKLLKTNKQQPQEAYYQHPDAYILTPEFKQTAQTINTVNAEAEHWRQQLLNIRGGKNWRAIEGYDANGQPVLSPEYKADDNAELDVQNAFNEASNMAKSERSKLEQLKSGFKQRTDKDIQLIETERKNRFEWAKNPELLEHKLDIPGVGPTTVKNVKEDFKGLFPAYLHSNPIMEVASDMFVALQIYAGQIRDLQANVKQEVKKKEEIIRAEPNPGNGNGSGVAKKSDDAFDLAGMPH